jgi:tRNA (adenine37-N6)-methyltransferase
MKTVTYRPIGVIYSPFTTREEAPLQPRVAHRARGRVEVFSEFRQGLADLNTFSHVFLLYHCHLAESLAMKVKPSHEESFHGVFATRAADRPNPIGISVVSLDSIEGSVLHVSNIDIVDGTPLLDIKPFIPSLDRQFGATIGWLAEKFRDL